MHTTTVEQLGRDLATAFAVADIDPARDTIASAVEKFNRLELRHLVLYIENGGFLCLCADAEMSRRFNEALEKIAEDLHAEEDEEAVDLTS